MLRIQNDTNDIMTQFYEKLKGTKDNQHYLNISSGYDQVKSIESNFCFLFGLFQKSH